MKMVFESISSRRVANLPTLCLGIADRFQESTINGDDGSTDELDAIAYDYFLAGHALHVGFQTCHMAFLDSYFLAFLQGSGTRDGGNVGILYYATIVEEFLVADAVYLSLTGHGEHLIDIRTETDVVEAAFTDMAEDERGKEDLLLSSALLGALVDIYDFLHGHPILKPDIFILKKELDGVCYALLTVASHDSYIPSCILRHNRLCIRALLTRS